MKIIYYSFFIAIVDLFLIVIISLFQSPNITDKYNVKDDFNYNNEYNLGEFYTLENLDYEISKIISGEITDKYSKNITYSFPCFEIILPNSYELLIKKGDIVNKGSIINKVGDNGERIDRNARLIGIDYEDEDKLIFESIDTLLPFTINFEKPYILDNLSFFYYKNNIKRNLTLESIDFSIDTGNYTFYLSGLFVDDEVISGLDVNVTLEIKQFYDNNYIDSSYLFYDENKDQYYLCKLYNSVNQGLGYILLAVEVVGFMGDMAIIEGYFNSQNVFVKII